MMGVKLKTNFLLISFESVVTVEMEEIQKVDKTKPKQKSNNLNK
jgi:hypothetical protein